ncbi:MAG: hypothetical protein U0744_00610 [Gemmataceae bacterium]
MPAVARQGQVPTRGAAIGLLVAGGVFATLWLVPALFTWVFLLVSMPLGLLGVVVLLEGSRQFRLAGLYLRAFEAFEAKKQAIRRESVCLAAAPHDIAAEPLVAKTALWEVDQEIDQLRRDAALARLDKEWEIELLKHYITPRRGKPYLPVKTQAAWILAGGILLGVFVAFVGTPRPRPLLGCIFGTIGIVGGIFMYAEADGYEQAYAKYQSRRKKIIEGP